MSTIDRALHGGEQADRLAFAFAAGYSEALRFLVPGLDGIAALCATEAEGNHPRAIKTRLAGGKLTGKKVWATGANRAASLLVVASTGLDTMQRNRLVVVRVPVASPGVTVKSSAASFIPEIEHAEIEFANVDVSPDQILPGDGYDDYLKPFRTVEDLHVHAALVGYLISVVRRYALPPEHGEALLALAAATRAIAAMDVKSPATHLALAGLLDLVTRVVADIERAWTAPSEELARWQRDRALLQVAGKARHARREAARAAGEAASTT